ncbi:hypothetical protein BWO91_02040 [Plantibacter flavus]|uniref:glycoside hydrolase family 99-like domain-containing protein n=1 Tax=Plantibacter flavus TaxID=150123 RepID=UPI00099B45CA|nr:glycoside hydrolase family 99-like domain-containing protein [Plantibacter flavus]AQX78941.1 hypothetical protein BWO91_02040 [Plantibacter flavus]
MTRPKVLAYYFPNWHADPRNIAWFGDGWDEWKLLDAAQPRFPGHRQPRIPLAGRTDGANPAVAEAEIDIAADHGVDGFLVDYYWYDDGPYLSGELDNGLLQARNRDRVDFALMWANHELVDIFPYSSTDRSRAPQLKNGAVDRAAFERMVDHIIEKYFVQSNYLTVDGRPWFSLYEIGNFIAGLGGVSDAADALGWFRDRVVAAGFPGLHLDAVVWGFGVLPTAITVQDPATLISQLGFDSATSYVWVHHADMAAQGFPEGDPAELAELAFDDYERLAAELPVPFHPNVTVGWDSTPRISADVEFRGGTYPFFPVFDQDPTQFAAALKRAHEFIARHPNDHPMITINAWNEWTEGSALLPDTTHGMAFLSAVRTEFGIDAGQESRVR